MTKQAEDNIFIRQNNKISFSVTPTIIKYYDETHQTTIIQPSTSQFQLTFYETYFNQQLFVNTFSHETDKKYDLFQIQ